MKTSKVFAFAQFKDYLKFLMLCRKLLLKTLEKYFKYTLITVFSVGLVAPFGAMAETWGHEVKM